ncbi:MAG: hypothetical protein LQ348_003402 [Seirophora lacunosa]|nr:MAG: hypothetical protein LQ348_003402 [Seirophora lacunosa]
MNSDDLTQNALPTPHTKCRKDHLLPRNHAAGADVAGSTQEMTKVGDKLKATVDERRPCSKTQPPPQQKPSSEQEAYSQDPPKLLPKNTGLTRSKQVLRTRSLSYHYLTPSETFTAPAAHSIPERYAETEYNMREFQRFLADWSHVLALTKLVIDRTDLVVVPASDTGPGGACNRAWQREVWSVVDRLVEVRQGFERLFEITLACIGIVR